MENLYKYRAELQSGINDFISHKLRDSSDSPWLNDFLKRLSIFLGGGKHLRGSLVCYAYEIYGGQPTPGVLNAAMSIELVHAGLIIQDDIIDQDEYRRGQPSMHRQYRSKGLARKVTEASDFAENMAICASDIAIFLGFELLAQTSHDPKKVLELNKIYTSSLAAVCEGQMQDIYLEASNKQPIKKSIFEVMRLKTASYSIVLPMMMGGVLSGMSRQKRDALSDIGNDIGMIFQIRDDELGALGNPETLGKPVGSDIKEGKKTLLYYYLFRKCSNKEKLRLDSIFGNKLATQKDIKFVQDLMYGYEIPDLVAKDVNRLRNSAFNKINQLSMPSNLKADLKDLTNFCSNRHT